MYDVILFYTHGHHLNLVLDYAPRVCTSVLSFVTVLPRYSFVATFDVCKEISVGSRTVAKSQLILVKYPALTLQLWTTSDGAFPSTQALE